MENNKIVEFSKWGKIYGILTIVSGALSCLSIFGAIFGVPVIFAGLRMKKGADKTKALVERKAAEGTALAVEDYEDVIGDVGVYSKIMGILTIVSFIVGILAIILYIILIVFFVATLGSGGYNGMMHRSYYY